MAYRTLLTLASACALWGASVAAHAQFVDMRNTSTLYMQGGLADKNAHSLTVGSTVPMGWNTNWWGHAVTTHWDMNLAIWNSEREDQSSRRNIAVLGIKPVLRFHSQSQYPWFVEAGVGAFVSNHLYETRDRHFSTAFNFGSHIGVGYFTGMKRENEWMLRVEHFSNASIKQPNPGENFIQLRYARHF